MFSPVQDCRSGPNKVRWESVSYILTERREVLTARLNVEIIWNFFCKNLKSGFCVSFGLWNSRLRRWVRSSSNKHSFGEKMIIERNGATPWVLYHCVTTAAVCGWVRSAAARNSFWGRPAPIRSQGTSGGYLAPARYMSNPSLVDSHGQTPIARTLFDCAILRNVYCP